MPIYEYACRKCGKTAEYMQRMSDPPKRKCEHCGSQSLERVISQTSFQLKGSGWYKDLYSSPKPAGGDTKSDSGSSGGESSESSTKSDAASGTTSDSAASGADAPSKPARKADAPKASSKGATKVASSGRGSSSSKAGGGKAKKGSR